MKLSKLKNTYGPCGAVYLGHHFLFQKPPLPPSLSQFTQNFPLICVQSFENFFHLQFVGMSVRLLDGQLRQFFQNLSNLLNIPKEKVACEINVN